VTPSFFKSLPCRDELTLFRDREKVLGRNDLIVPMYYVNCRALSDEQLRENDELAELIASRQWADWRGLRFEPGTLRSGSPTSGITSAELYSRRSPSRLGDCLSLHEEQALLTAWYDLFGSGHLSWGYNLNNPDPPFCHTTEQGRRTLAQISRDPSNPDGYMAHLMMS
jgi:hypothetical protein